VSYEGRVLRYNDQHGHVVVYVLSDERDVRINAQKITVLTLDDVDFKLKSDLVWWWFYDADRGLESNLWEIML